MQNYERLIMEKLGDGLTPKAKYERLEFLLGAYDRLQKAKQQLQSNVEWFGMSNPRHGDAQEILDILNGND